MKNTHKFKYYMSKYTLKSVIHKETLRAYVLIDQRVIEDILQSETNKRMSKEVMIDLRDSIRIRLKRNRQHKNLTSDFLLNV